MVLAVNIKESINTAKMYAKQLEEELLDLMDAHSIDAIRRTGAEGKVKNLHDALAEIEKEITKKPKPEEKPKDKKTDPVEGPRPTPIKTEDKKTEKKPSWKR